MSTENLILTEIDENNLVTLTINRPDALNALNSDVLNEFNRVLETFLSVDQKPSGMIITGAGDKAFIAGADIKSMANLSSDEAADLSRLGQQTTLLLESMPFPVIACVAGFTLGGGLEMAMGADFIYATDRAVFGLPEVKLGLIPGFGGTQRLARYVGRQMAKELTYTGRMIKAEEARRIGLVNQVFPSKEELIAAANKTLLEARENSLESIAIAKGLINTTVDHDLVEGLEKEASTFGGLFSSEDSKEGIAAFCEKRKANFKHL